MINKAFNVQIKTDILTNEKLYHRPSLWFFERNGYGKDYLDLVRKRMKLVVFQSLTNTGLWLLGLLLCVTQEINPQHDDWQGDDT